MKVGVIGGGVIGLCIAQRLTRDGAEVVVLERDECGEAASRGNAGWITPGLSTPLPAPGVMRKALRWMLDSNSPLLVRPRLDPSFMAWSWQFARNCRPEPCERGSRALLAFNARTHPTFDALREDGVEFEHHAVGWIAIALSDHALDEEWEAFLELQRLGYDAKIERLDAAALRSLEPAVGPEVEGGVYSDGEAHVRPETLTRGLAEWLRARDVDVREHTTVLGLSRNGRGWRIQTSGDAVDVDRVVVASGVWTRALLERLGTKIPLEGAKGYSITAPSADPMPRHALMLHEAKIGVSPYEGGLRFAGTLELAGLDLSLNHGRIGALQEAATRYLPGYRPSSGDVKWAGLRPTLPDGLPAIGRVPTADGVFAATGHAMLGVTLAPATADAIAPLVLEDRLEPDLEPFALDRRYA